MGNAESLAAEAEAAKAKRQSHAFERASATRLSATRKQKLSRHIIDLVEIYADLVRRDRNYAYEAVKAFIESHQEDINYCDEVIYRVNKHFDVFFLQVPLCGKWSPYSYSLSSKQNGRTALMAARELGHQDLVSLLLRHGAFVDTIDKVKLWLKV